MFYENHNNYLNDLMLRIQLYNRLYRKDLTNYFNEWGKRNKNTNISITKEDFERAIWGNYYLEKDLSKFPLSKLTKDIVRQYK